MQILSVTLQNFKSHADRHFAFEMGTNAICGENGAGKTSILEAIAWVLFDCIPYTIDDTIREGAKSAEVTVAFVSAIEDRTYQVRRSTATGYRLYDPQIDRRLEPEKKADVLCWLRQHLGVPAGTDLARLFSNTIGVPQGTFTADFLKTAQDRKRIFDSILKVEEYQNIYRDLLSLQKYSEEQVNHSDHRIELCQVQLQDWEQLQHHQLELQQAIARDTELLDGVNERLAKTKTSLAALEKTATDLQSLDRRIQQTENSKQLKQQDVERAQADVAAAQQAATIVESNSVGHAAYQAAEQKLQQLEQQRQQRQVLQEQRQTLLEASYGREPQRAQLQERLSLLEQAETQIENLEPLVVQQQELEQTQQQLTDHLQQLQQLQHQHSLLGTQLETYQHNVQQAKSELQSARNAHERRERNREAYDRVCQADSALAQLRDRQQQREHLRQDQAEAITALSSIQQKQATLQEQLERSQAIDRDIEQLNQQLPQQEALEATQSQLEQQKQHFQTLRVTLQQRVEAVDDVGHEIATVQAKIERRQALSETTQTIPTLRQQIERCTHQLAHQSAARDFYQELDHIHHMGRENLADYRQQSKALLQDLEDTSRTHPTVRPILDTVSPLLRQGHSISQELLAQVADILTDLNHQTDEAALKAERRELDRQLQDALLAQSRMDELPTLMEQQQQAQQRLAKINESIADLKRQLETEATCLKQLEDTGKQLQDLGNPRSQIAILRQERQRYSTLDRQWQQLQRSLSKQQATVEKLEHQLQETADLPQQIATQQKIRQEFQAAYQQFLKLEEQANSLSKREQHLDLATQKLENLQTELTAHQLKRDEWIQERGDRDDIKAKQSEIVAELERLQNPKQQVKRLKADVLRRPNLQKQLDKLNEIDRQERQQLEALQAELKSTQDIDRQYQTCRQERDSHSTAFQAVLAHQALAQTLPQQKKQQTLIGNQLQEIETTLKTFNQDRQALSETFDQTTFDQLARDREEGIKQHTQLTTQLQSSRPQLEQLQQKLANLEALRKQVSELQAEKKQRQRLQRFIKYIRKVFRDAGPRITELYQTNVNREADRLFREILNRPTVSLQWESNYDITVQEGGSQKRKFASLSGGEQMVAALAVRLALLRALADIDVAFFDEPTTNMDRPRRERLAEAISNIKSFKQLFVISHDDTFANITENIIRVERQT